MTPGPIYPRIDPRSLPLLSEADKSRYDDFSEREMLIMTVETVKKLVPEVDTLKKDVYELKVKVYSFAGMLALLSLTGGMLWLVNMLA